MRLGRYDLWTAEGDAGSGLATVAYAGTKAYKNHFFRLIFSRAFFEHDWGRLPYWEVEALLARTRKKPALVVHEVSAARARFFTLESDVRIPVWLSVEYDLGSVDPARSPHFVDARRRIRNQGFEPAYSSSPSDVDEFYRGIYAPYAKRRYGASRVLLGIETLRRKFPNAEIVRILKDGECVAAGFIDGSSDKPNLSTLGTVSGRDEWMRLGAIDAVYYFSLMRMRQKGFACAGLGYVRPFLEDGALKHALHFGANLVPAHAPHPGLLHVKINGKTGRHMLAPHPFVSFEEGRYILTAFSNGNSEPDILKKLENVPAREFDIRILPL
jgi:hypothetical protein